MTSRAIRSRYSSTTPCHPVVFGPDNLRYSVDYPAAMTRHVEGNLKRGSRSPICFFVQGAPGDINPFLDKTPLPENADQEMRNRRAAWPGSSSCRTHHRIRTSTAP